MSVCLRAGVRGREGESERTSGGQLLPSDLFQTRRCEKEQSQTHLSMRGITDVDSMLTFIFPMI